MLGDNLIEGQLEPLIDSVLSDAAAASILLTPVSNPNLNAADSIFGDHVFLSGPSVQKEPGQYFLGDKSVLKMVNTDQQ